MTVLCGDGNQVAEIHTCTWPAATVHNVAGPYRRPVGAVAEKSRWQTEVDRVCSNGTSGGQGGQRDPFCGPWQRWRHNTAQYGNNSNSNAISKSNDKLTTE